MRGPVQSQSNPFRVSLPSSGLALFLAGCMLFWSAFAWGVPSGQEGVLSGPVPRWPLVLVASVILVVSIAALRLKKSWGELGERRGSRALRAGGILTGSVGVFLLAMSLTHAPPLYSGQDGLVWHTDLDEAQRLSASSDRILMLDFTAQWCNACHELEAEVFEQPEVRERLERDVVLVKVDFDRAAEENGELLAKYDVAGLPRVAFADSSGELMVAPSFEGKLGKEDFLERLALALKGGAAADAGSERSEFEKTLEDRGVLSALLLVFLAGFLSSLTPCVYPLIPITISVFGASGAKSRGHGFVLSVVYVLGIALTYSLLGVMAASFGSVFGGAMQHPVVILGLVALFVVLGLSSAGLFDLRLPGDLQTRLSGVGGAGLLGSFLMGLVAGIIAAPCVGPIVAGVLLYVASKQDVWLGGGMLFVFALGLGVIFLVLGTFSSLIQRLPRAGGWMESVKVVFGVVFFGMALYYLRYVLPAMSEGVEILWRWVAELLA